MLIFKCFMKLLIEYGLEAYSLLKSFNDFSWVKMAHETIHGRFVDIVDKFLSSQRFNNHILLKNTHHLSARHFVASHLLLCKSMKTLTSKTLILFATLLQMSALIMSCSGGGGSSTPAVVPNASGYGLNSAGQCINPTTNAVAPSAAYCASSANGYSLNTLGQCVYTATGAVQNSTLLCTQGISGTNGYSLNTLGQCVQTATGMIAQSPSYCSTGAGGTGGQCIGTYIYQSYNGSQTGTCQTVGARNNCSGYTLTNAQTGQSQQCM